VSSTAFSSIKLAGVSFISQQNGHWTKVKVRIKNSLSVVTQAEIKIITGDLEDGLSSLNWNLKIPANSQYAIDLPLFIPKNSKKNDRNQHHITQNRKAHKGTYAKKRNRHFKRSLKGEIQLLKNGAIVDRDSFIGPLVEKKLIKGLIVGESASANKNPSELWEKPEIRGLDLKICGENSHLKFSMASDVDLYSLPKLLDYKVIILRNKELIPFGWKNLLDWTQRGGLLIIDPNARVPNAMSKILKFKNNGSRLGTLAFENKTSGPFLGSDFVLETPWQSYYDLDEQKYASMRPWGLGRMVCLNYSLFLLTHLGEKSSTALMERWMPEDLPSILSSGGGLKHTIEHLKEKSGQQVWGKMTVSFYLGSFLILIMSISMLPKFKHQPEWRWGLWCGGLLLWTFVGFGIYFYSVDQKTRLSTFSFKMYSPDSSQMNELAVLHWFSGQKRRFPIHFDTKERWKLFQNSNLETKLSDKKLSWDNFQLAPQVEKAMIWKSDGDFVAPLSAPPKLQIGSKWSLTCPKEWRGNSIYLVMGRRFWSFQCRDEQTLDFDRAGSLKDFDILEGDTSWAHVIKEIFLSETGDLNLKHQVFLFRSSLSFKKWNVPKDIVLAQNGIEIWPLSPTLTGEKISWLAGAEEWTFQRAGTERRNQRGFDGLRFSDIGNLEINFKLPTWMYRSIAAESLELNFSKPLDAKSYQFIVQLNGRDKNLIPKGKRIKIPKECWSGQELKLMVKSRKRIRPNQMSSSKTEKAPAPFELIGLALHGKINPADVTINRLHP
jgi:hypothetical protein